MEFERSRVIENIYSVAKEKNIKIGVLENEAKMSPGYISRLLKEENKGSLLAEQLWKIAEALGTTMDSLVCTNSNGLTENEKKLIRFLDKLTLQTEKSEIGWEMMPPMISDISYIYKHPLFEAQDRTAEDPDGNFHYYQENVYCSHFFDPQCARIENNCFHFLFDEFSNREIYVMSVTERNKSSYTWNRGVLEIYFIVAESDIEPVVCSEFASDPVKDSMNRLYTAINEARSHLKLNKTTIAAIDRFLG